MGGSASFGLTMAYYSPAQEGICRDLELSSTAGTIFNALAALMSIITGTCIHFVITRAGRRLTTLFTAIVATASWLLLPLTTKKTWYLAFLFRGLLGLTVGAFSSVCPLYITELSPLELRGAYGVFHQFGVVIGASLSYFLGIWFNWKKLSFLSAIPPGLCCCLIMLVPESPHHVPNSEIQKSTEKESLCQKKYAKSLTISFFLMFFQQFSGVNGFLSTLESMFKDCGSSIKPSIAAFLVGFSGMISTGCSAPLVHCIGHRPAWHISSSMCCLTLLITALNSFFKWSNYIPVICMFIDNLVFGLGYGPIPWVITPELFPDSVRPIATSLMTALNWSFATIVMFLFPVMQRVLGFPVSVLIFSVICFFGFVFGIGWIPDTHGKEMGQIYDDQVSSEPLISTTSSN